MCLVPCRNRRIRSQRSRRMAVLQADGKNDFPGRAPDEFTTHLGRSMPDSVRGFDIERSENNVDLQEQKPGLDNLQAAADAALNGRAEPAFDHERARVHRRRRASPWAPHREDVAGARKPRRRCHPAPTPTFWDPRTSVSLLGRMMVSSSGGADVSGSTRASFRASSLSLPARADARSAGGIGGVRAAITLLVGARPQADHGAASVDAETADAD